MKKDSKVLMYLAYYSIIVVFLFMIWFTTSQSGIPMNMLYLKYGSAEVNLEGSTDFILQSLSLLILGGIIFGIIYLFILKEKKKK